MLLALRLLLMTTLLAVPSLSCVAAAAQLQSPPNRSRGFGPDACGPVDPSYIHVANETGGQPMFLQRSEAAKAMHLMRETTRSNVETVFRATGKLLRNRTVCRIDLLGHSCGQSHHAPAGRFPYRKKRPHSRDGGHSVL